MPRGSRRARLSGLTSLIAAVVVLAACREHGPDGGPALSAFRGYIADAFSEKRGDSKCDLSADVRATQGVAEPWEGILHADIFILENGGKRNPFGWAVDAVFDRAGSSWRCSPTKSKSADPTMKACETLERFCQQSQPTSARKEIARRAEAATPAIATQYPDGWQDLPSYGAALVDYAGRKWGCVTKRLPTSEVVKRCTVYRNEFRFSGAELAITLRTSEGTPPSNGSPTATLTFTPSRETGYAQALADVVKHARRPPDAKREHGEEAGTARTACWHDKDSTTSIASAHALAKGSIITVTARDPQRCAQ